MACKYFLKRNLKLYLLYRFENYKAILILHYWDMSCFCLFSLFPALILSSEEPLFTPDVLKFNNKVACFGSVFTHWTEELSELFQPENLYTSILEKILMSFVSFPLIS